MLCVLYVCVCVYVLCVRNKNRSDQHPQAKFSIISFDMEDSINDEWLNDTFI